MKTTLSRRAILAGATATAVAATSTAITDANPDAELLALGARLEPIIAEWITGRAIDRRNGKAHEAACLDADLPVLDIHSVPYDQWLERIKVRDMVHYMGKNEAAADATADGCSIKWNRIHGQLYPLCDDILSRRATSVPGLGVQARAASIYFEELWDSYGQDDEDLALAQRSFIESVCNMAGIVPVPVEAAARSGSPIPSRALPAPEPDPIFAAIEARREVNQSIINVIDAYDEPTPEDDAELDRLHDIEREAFIALVSTKPTTRAGAVALLRYMAEYEAWSQANDSERAPVKLKGGTEYSWHFLLLNTVADALGQMAVAS